MKICVQITARTPDTQQVFTIKHRIIDHDNYYHRRWLAKTALEAFNKYHRCVTYRIRDSAKITLTTEDLAEVANACQE